jgi:hypothetical protein
MSSKSLIFFSRISLRYSCTKFDFPRIIRRKAELSADYTVERHAFSEYNSWKVKTFCRFYRGKVCSHELFCIKAGFSMVKSMESFYFSHTILRKGMPFRRIIHGKSKLPAYYTAKKHAFLQDNPRKVKTFRESSCGKLQYSAESLFNKKKMFYYL